jgi:hypothetical protein
LDPTSAAFAAFANQPAGLFTPTPGVNGTSSFGTLPTTAVAISHDLQTPNIGLSVDSPLSMSNGTSLPAVTSTAGSAFAVPQTIQPHQFQDYQPFAQSLHPQYLNPSQYDPRPPSGPGSPMDLSGNGEMLAEGITMDDSMAGVTPIGSLAPPMPLDEKQFDHIAQLLPPSSERFVSSRAYDVRVR